VAVRHLLDDTVTSPASEPSSDLLHIATATQRDALGPPSFALEFPLAQRRLDPVAVRTRRFEDFQRQLGVTRHLLADRLRKLVEAGILEKVRYQEKPARYEYRLTDKGLDLYPVVVSILRWGDRWMAGDDAPPLTLVHETCGHRMHPTLVCPDCGEPLGPRDVVAEIGPAE
jgi:DNA-binding HxlR family transcriptional regulator